MAIVRKLVSGDKYRYVDDSFDLDLRYITERIIAMGVPAANGIEKLWRNSANSVSAFLNQKHSNHYTVFNLSGENYDYSKFHQVKEYFFPDHSAPDLLQLMEILYNVHWWLHQHSENIAVIHCLAGRSRTGCVVAAYLLFSGMFHDAQSAINHFNQARSINQKNIVLPSQIRIVEYVDKIMKNYNNFGLRISPSAFLQNPSLLNASGQSSKLSNVFTEPFRLLHLVGVSFSPVPGIEVPDHAGNPLTFSPIIQIFSQIMPRKMIWQSKVTRVFETNIDYEGDVQLSHEDDIQLHGDIQIKFYHQTKSRTKFAALLGSDGVPKKVALSSATSYPLLPLFRLTFNTNFVESSWKPPAFLARSISSKSINSNFYELKFKRDELDAVLAGSLQSSFFPESFSVSLFFTSEANHMNMAPPSSNYFPAIFPEAPTTPVILPPPSVSPSASPTLSLQQSHSARRPNMTTSDSTFSTPDHHQYAIDNHHFYPAPQHQYQLWQHSAQRGNIGRRASVASTSHSYQSSPSSMTSFPALPTHTVRINVYDHGGQHHQWFEHPPMTSPPFRSAPELLAHAPSAPTLLISPPVSSLSSPSLMMAPPEIHHAASVPVLTPPLSSSSSSAFPSTPNHSVMMPSRTSSLHQRPRIPSFTPNAPTSLPASFQMSPSSPTPQQLSTTYQSPPTSSLSSPSSFAYVPPIALEPPVPSLSPYSMGVAPQRSSSPSLMMAPPSPFDSVPPSMTSPSYNGSISITSNDGRMLYPSYP